MKIWLDYFVQSACYSQLVTSKSFTYLHEVSMDLRDAFYDYPITLGLTERERTSLTVSRPNI